MKKVIDRVKLHVAKYREKRAVTEWVNGIRARYGLAPTRLKPAVQGCPSGCVLAAVLAPCRTSALTDVESTLLYNDFLPDSSPEHRHEIVHPSFVSDFINDFDYDRYPELVAGYQSRVRRAVGRLSDLLRGTGTTPWRENR